MCLVCFWFCFLDSNWSTYVHCIAVAVVVWLQPWFFITIHFITNENTCIKIVYIFAIKYFKTFYLLLSLLTTKQKSIERFFKFEIFVSLGCSPSSVFRRAYVKKKKKKKKKKKHLASFFHTKFSLFLSLPPPPFFLPLMSEFNPIERPW